MLQFHRQDWFRLSGARCRGVTVAHGSDKAADGTDAGMTAAQGRNFSAKVKILRLDANARRGG